MASRPDILVVDGNDDDADLTVRAFKQACVQHNVIRVRDGALALDYLLGRGSYAQRNVNDVPAVIVLHLTVPGLGRFEALAGIRDDDRIKHLPVVNLASSNGEKDRLAAYKHFADTCIRKPAAYDQFVVASRELGLYWLVFNESLPSEDTRRVRRAHTGFTDRS